MCYRFISVGTLDEPHPSPELFVFFPDTPEDCIHYKNYRKVSLVGHTNSIFDIKWIPSTEDLVSCGSIDRSIRLWNVDEGKEKQRIQSQDRSCISELYTPYETDPFSIFSCDSDYFDESPIAFFFPKDDNLFVLCSNNQNVYIHDKRNFNVPVATLDSGCTGDNSVLSIQAYNGHVILSSETELRIYDLEYGLLTSHKQNNRRNKILIEHGMCFFNDDEGVSYFDISSVVKGNEWSITNLGGKGSGCLDDCIIEDIVTSPFGLVSISSCGLFKCWKFL
jgi:WD40 repeat protein